MPRNIVMLITPSVASVAAALRDCGRRNAWTPSAMASTPVSAVAPDENARSRTNRLSACTTGSSRSADAATGQPPTHRSAPTTIVTKTVRMKPYVGTANSVPASFTPRRFKIVISRMNEIAISTRSGASDGAAETTATVPAVTLTATVRT